VSVWKICHLSLVHIVHIVHLSIHNRNRTLHVRIHVLYLSTVIDCLVAGWLAIGQDLDLLVVEHKSLVSDLHGIM